jgi:hypothetical protein
MITFAGGKQKEQVECKKFETKNGKNTIKKRI